MFSQESPTFFGVTPSLFMEEGCYPLYMGSGRFPSEMEREGGTLFPVMTCSSLYIEKMPLSFAF